MITHQRAIDRDHSGRRVRPVVRAHAASVPRTVILIIAGAVLISGFCLLYLWQGTAILSLTAQRESARAALTSIEEVNRYLEFKVDQAFSLDRIERIARQELHMQEPKVVRYVVISP